MEQAIRLEQGKTYIVKQARTSYPFIIKIIVLEITETTYYLKNNDTGINFRALKTDFLYNHNICEEIIPAVNAECPDQGSKEISPALYSDKKIPISEYFEVLAYNVKGDTYWLKTDGYYHNGRGDIFYKYEPLYAEPWSVKRSSDGEIFTIHDLNPDTKAKIDAFLLYTDEGEIKYENGVIFKINSCKAPAEPTQKKQVCPEKKYSQSEVDAIRKEAGLHYFREGYKYLRATDEKIVSYDKLAEMTVVGAFENLIRKESNLNCPEKIEPDTDLKSTWEIQSFLKEGSVLQLSNYKYRNELNSIGLANCLSFKFPINAVKRLTDNEVFTIGDNDQFGTITGFEISGDYIFVRHERGQSLLDHCVMIARKKPHPITKGDDAPFFITDDGKSISHMGECVIVELPFYNIFKTVKTDNIKRPNRLYFSTYHAARCYVIENSPISIKELQEIQNKNNTHGHALIGHAISLISSRVPYKIP